MSVATQPFLLLDSPDWTDYALLDSGHGSKLERFGPYTFVRPEPQAIWRPGAPEAAWNAASATFQRTDEHEGGMWHFRQTLRERWQMNYKGLRFWVQPTPFRHMGVFPEQANHWDWMQQRIKAAGRPIRVLNLFGYTGIASLAAAAAGATVTHVDASKKMVGWARENQDLSELSDRPIRWLLDDALKFVRREARRDARYDGFIIDPPPFGRGPKGELWRLEESLPSLLDSCREIMSDTPLFAILTAYAIRTSALSLQHCLAEMVRGMGGALEAGEMVINEQSEGRLLSTAIFARWDGSGITAGKS